MENFDLKKFLVENKLTTNSRILEETDKGNKITTSDIQKLSQHPKIKAFANNLVTNHPEIAEKVLDFIQKKLGINTDTSLNESLESLTQDDLNKAIAKGEAMAGESESEIVSEIANNRFKFLASLGPMFVGAIVSIVTQIVSTSPIAATLGFMAVVVGTVIALGAAIKDSGDKDSEE